MLSDRLRSQPAQQRRQQSIESSFAAACVELCRQHGECDMQAYFPLRNRVRLRSEVSLGYPSQEYCEGAPGRGRDAGSGEPTLHLGFLTLAGLSGVLPGWLNEKLLWLRGSEEGALHAFLDLLNRRFWELSFLAHAVGNNAHYAVLNSKASGQVATVVRTVAGLGGANDAMADSHGEEDAGLQLVLQHCVAAGRGPGAANALAALLSRLFGVAITVREHVPLSLETVPQARAGLRSRRIASGLGTSCVLGSRAWVACALEFSVTLPRAIDGFLPLLGAPQWQRLHRLASELYAESLPPITLKLRGPATPHYAALGAHQMRLGWGAGLACTPQHSMLVTVSARAASRAA